MYHFLLIISLFFLFFPKKYYLCTGFTTNEHATKEISNYSSAYTLCLFSSGTDRKILQCRQAAIK